MGFMQMAGLRRRRLLANCKRSLLLLCLLPLLASAADVQVVALMRDKATLVIDGAAPRTLAVGQSSPEGVKLLAADSGSATIEIAGLRQTIAAGERAQIVATSIASGPRSVTLYPDAQGHFVTIGSVDGVPLRFVVDSGASLVVIPANEAQRAGIHYLNGERSSSLTANGPVGVYHVHLRSVKLGELELKNVDADVSDAPMSASLLGMSFLSRVSMERDGRYMRLAQREDGSAGGESAAGQPAASGHARVVLSEQRGGHFFTSGSINGGAVSFMVDTGATLVAISVADARRMGINYLHGQPGTIMTANGRAPMYLMKFDEVRVGDIVLRNVDGAVLEGNTLPIALLGMSFLNRTDIRRNGNSMTLTQRF
jgi:aspartyl protease family protein